MQVDPVVSMTMKAAEQAEGPRPLYIAISVTLGFLVALTTGILHRTDTPDPAVPTIKYSIQAAVMKAGIALFSTASVTLTILISPERGTSCLILLISAVVGVSYGLLARFDTTSPNRTVQTAILRGATLAVSAWTLWRAGDHGGWRLVVWWGYAVRLSGSLLVLWRGFVLFGAVCGSGSVCGGLLMWGFVAAAQLCWVEWSLMCSCFGAS